MLWQIWLIIALVLLGLEFLTTGFLVIFFSFAALLTCLVAIFIPQNLIIQLIVFSATSLLSVFIARPLLKKYAKFETEVKPSTIDALKYKEGIVISPINETSIGQVKINGEIWSAKSLTGETLNNGEKVIVSEVDGVKLIVMKAEH